MHLNSSVVILDTDPIHVRLLEKALVDEGMTATCCESVEECQEKLKSGIVSVVFVDLWASKARNLSFIRWVRLCWPNLRVIAMSNIDSLFVELESLNRGADFFLPSLWTNTASNEYCPIRERPNSFSGLVQSSTL